ncbi:MAG: GAF domain-containing protein [Chloroflexi bacterium]|nr:GAF domain-containing protein [Chloroflexota bacterium]
MRDRSIAKFCRRVWNWLTEPSALVREPDQKRQARLLAALFILIIPIGLIRAALPNLLEPARGTIWILPEFQAMVAVSVFVLIAYGLTRTRYYALAAVGLIVLSTVAIFFAMLPLAASAKFAGFYYLVLPVLFASIFFSARLACVVGVIDLCGIGLMPFFFPQLPADDLYLGPFSFVVITSLIILLMTYYRNLVERSRQAELAASEERYRSLAEAIPDSIFIITRADQIAYVNSFAAAMLNRMPQDVIGKARADFFPANTNPTQARDLARVFETGQALRAETQTQFPNAIVWLDLHFVPLKDPNGATQAVLGVARDITARKRAEEEIRQRTAQLESLRQIGLELTAKLHLDDLLQSIAQRAVELTRAAGGGLYLYDAARDRLVRRVSAGKAFVAVGAVRQRGESLTGKILESGAPLIVDDYAQLPGHSPLPNPAAHLPAMGAPICWGDDLLGVLAVGRDAARPFQKADVEVLEMIASHAAIAMRNARALEAEEHQRRRAEALAQATAVLSQTLELEPLLENVLRAAIQAIPVAEKGSVLLVDEPTGDLCVRASVGYTDPRIHHLRLTPGIGYTRRALEAGAPILFANLRTGEWDQLAALTEAHALQSAIVAPLRFQDKVIGVLSLDNATRVEAFTADDCDLLAAFANQAAAAIENAHLHQRVAIAGARSAAFAMLGQQLNAASTPAGAAQMIVDIADRLLGWDACFFSLYSTARDEFRIILQFDVLAGARANVTTDRVIKPTPAFRRILERGAWLINRDQSEPAVPMQRFGDTARQSASLMFVPIRNGLQTLGVLSIQSYTPRAYSQESLDLLQSLADHCGGALERIRVTEQIRVSLAEKEVLLKEIHHRVKNNLQIISSLLNLQNAQIKDPTAREVLRDSQNRVRSMALVHERLYRAEDLARVDLGEYARGLSANILRSYGATTERIALAANADSVLVGIDIAISCGLILNELIANAVKHAFPGERRGTLRVELRADAASQVRLIVADDGIGFPADLDFRNTTSLGLQLVTTLVNQLNGRIELTREHGTQFTVIFSTSGSA